MTCSMPSEADVILTPTHKLFRLGHRVSPVVQIPSQKESRDAPHWKGLNWRTMIGIDSVSCDRLLISNG